MDGEREGGRERERERERGEALTLDELVYTCNPVTWEAKAGGS